MAAGTTGLASSASPSSELADESAHPTKEAPARKGTMQAIVYNEYGSADVLTLQEIDSRPR